MKPATQPGRQEPQIGWSINGTIVTIAYQLEGADWADWSRVARDSGDLERSARLQRFSADCYRIARRRLGMEG